MPGFAEVQFPPDISYGSTGGPEYTTDIVISTNGHEQRNVSWSQSRARYNVAKGVKTKAQLDTLIAFFRARKGRAYGFRFKDWTDYQASGQAIGTGNGSATTFQLAKTYNNGGATEMRTITKPVGSSVKIYKAGVLQASGVSVNAATGLVTLSPAPANGAAITADFEFDVPVRFDTDRLAVTLDSYGLNSWLDIPLIEVRV